VRVSTLWDNQNFWKVPLLHFKPLSRVVQAISFLIRDGSLFMGMTGSGKKWPGCKKLWSWNDGLRLILFLFFVFLPKDRVLKKKTVLYEKSRPLQCINVDECTILQQCWIWQSVIGHRPTKFCCNTLSLHTYVYSIRQTVHIKLKTNVHVCFE